MNIFLASQKLSDLVYIPLSYLSSDSHCTGYSPFSIDLGIKENKPRDLLERQRERERERNRERAREREKERERERERERGKEREKTRERERKREKEI